MTRDRDGNIVDKDTTLVGGKTVKLEDKTVKLTDDEARTALYQSGEQGVDYESGTVKMDDSTSSITATSQADDERTRIVGSRRHRERVQRMARRAEHEDSMDDPIAGWLVVVEGPGKGRALTLGYGMNSIGRAADERISIDFGDDQISRRGHAVVTYESRGRKFYVQPGGGTNLAYLGEDAVLTPTELPADSYIAIGNTKLRFVPLCGKMFDWGDTEEDQPR